MRDHCRASARRRALSALGRILAYDTVARSTVPELVDERCGAQEQTQAITSQAGYSDYDDFSARWLSPQAR